MAYCPFRRDSLPAPQGGLRITVMVAEADFVESVTDVALIVTVAGAGTAAGAV
jgi:hypothetical protein